MQVQYKIYKANPTNHAISARFRIDPKSDYINIYGRIVWKIQMGVESQVGVEIDVIDAGANNDLGYPFNMWKDKMRSR